jgi:exosortase
MDSIALRNLWKPLVLAAAIAFVYFSVLARLGRFWWDDPNYSHGLLIPFIIGYILWSERASLAREPKRPAMLLGGAAVFFALLMLWAGTAGAEIFTQRTSLVLLLAGVVVYFWGLPLLRLVFVPLLLLLLAIPIPAIIFNKIAFPLQLFASRCAVGVMRLLDIPVLRDGNVIELKPLFSPTTKRLEVVEACSGIRSLMTLVTLAVVFAYFTSPGRGGAGSSSSSGGDGGGGNSNWSPRRWPFWRATILVLSAVPIAIITNAARVSGTGVLAHYYVTTVADGFFHSFSGWVVYIVAFLMLFGVGWLLDRLSGTRGGGRGGSSRRERTSKAVVARDEAVADNTAANEAGTIGGTPSAALSVGVTKTP